MFKTIERIGLAFCAGLWEAKRMQQETPTSGVTRRGMRDRVQRVLRGLITIGQILGMQMGRGGGAGQNTAE